MKCADGLWKQHVAEARLGGPVVEGQAQLRRKRDFEDDLPLESLTVDRFRFWIVNVKGPSAICIGYQLELCACGY